MTGTALPGGGNDRPPMNMTTLTTTPGLHQVVCWRTAAMGGRSYPGGVGLAAISEASQRRPDDTANRLGALLADGWQLIIERRTADCGVILAAEHRGSLDIAASELDHQAATRSG